MLELPEDCPDYDYGLRVVGKEEQEQMDKAVAGIPAGEQAFKNDQKNLLSPFSLFAAQHISYTNAKKCLRSSIAASEPLGRPISPLTGPSGILPSSSSSIPGVTDVKMETGDDALNSALASSTSGTGSTQNGKPPKIEFPADAFHMVTQTNWEDDIIWNGEDIKHKVLSKLNSKSNAAGWVPSSLSRTAGSFSQRPGVKPELQIRLATLGKKLPQNDDDTWYSIFPVENEELVYGRWEDEVIWDTENMPKKLEPRIVSLDPNDENIIIAIPDDIDPSTLPNEEPTRKIKIIQKHVKKSKLLLNRAGIISVVEEESPPPPPKTDDRDSFYIGNDEFYLPKEPASMIKVATGGSLLQHATPNVQLQAPFIPTHMGPIKLRQFHRFSKFSLSYCDFCIFPQMADQEIFPWTVVSVHSVPRSAELVQAPEEDGEVENGGEGGGRRWRHLPHEGGQGPQRQGRRPDPAGVHRGIPTADIFCGHVQQDQELLQAEARQS